MREFSLGIFLCLTASPALAVLANGKGYILQKDSVMSVVHTSHSAGIGDRRYSCISEESPTSIEIDTKDSTAHIENKSNFIIIRSWKTLRLKNLGNKQSIACNEPRVNEYHGEKKGEFRNFVLMAPGDNVNFETKYYSSSNPSKITCKFYNEQDLEDNNQYSVFTLAR